MKKATYFLIYAAACVLGVLLLIFGRDALAQDVPSTMRGIVIAGGIVFIIGGAVVLLRSMRPKYSPNGVMQTRPWYLSALSIACLFWGILMVVLSSTFTFSLAVTLGVSLILAAMAQTIFIADAAKPYGASGWWYVVPVAVFGAGIIDVTLVNDYSSLMQSNMTAAIVSGILLLCFGVNGFGSLNRRQRVEREVIESVNAINPRKDDAA